ncbi:DNA-directed RNA polymerase subunit L [archaeon]|nr:DNA-directed RNA polymerase subunit L [archaeon]
MAMETRVLEKTENKLKLEIIGKTHTLCNCLVHELWNDKNILVAGYQLEHPILSNATLIVETKKEDPVKVMQNAIKRLKKQNADFLDKFKAVAK